MRVGLMLQIDQIIKDELDAAKKKFPANNSRHESYAVLREEFEEMQDEERKLSNELDNIWDAVKKNTDPDVLLKYLNRVQNISRQLTAEAVQTAAMADKFVEYMNSELRGGRNAETKKPAPKQKVAPVQPKKEWTDKQKKDIQLIKDAHKAKRAKVKLETLESRKGRTRGDIDNDLIVYMRDEQKMKFAAIAKQMKCCEQTVINRYNAMKGNTGKKKEA